MQQLLEQNKYTLLEEFKQKMFENSNDMLIYSKFRVGCIENKEEYLYILRMYNLLNSKNCNIFFQIEDSIIDIKICRKGKKRKKHHHCCPTKDKHNDCQESNITKIEW